MEGVSASAGDAAAGTEVVGDSGTETRIYEGCCISIQNQGGGLKHTEDGIVETITTTAG